MIAAPKNPQTLLEAMRHFDPETARKYVASIKWPDGPVCPGCGSQNVGTIASRQRFQCREKGCRKQFSLLTGTIFESTHLRLDQWMVAVWMIAGCRNGVSSCEIARAVGCKQQSAWHLLHRVRHLLQQEPMEKMWGTVEADTTLVGGILKNMPHRRRKQFQGVSRLHGKTIIHALRCRETGEVRATVITTESQAEVSAHIKDNVLPGTSIHTDSANTYAWLSREGFGHHTVNHNRKEYVRGNVTTNGIEGFFNCARRALKGSYIRASPEHLMAYVDESVFRYNVRAQTDWERFETAMKLVLGKRLTYFELTDGAKR